LEPLVIENVSKTFGGLQALTRVDLRIESGERRVVIGPNGAGKTTLFNIISGLIPPSRGKVLIFGQDATSMPPHRRTGLGLGRTFQITNLFSNMTLFDNLLLSLKALDRTRRFTLRPLSSFKHLHLQAEALLGQSGLLERRHILVRNRSYGEQRQLEVTMALAQSPRLLLLDEFTSGLAPAEISNVTSVLKSLSREITLLLIEHDMDVAFDVGESFTVLHMGRVFAEGSSEEIKGNDRVQQIYLGSKQ